MKERRRAKWHNRGKDKGHWNMLAVYVWYIFKAHSHQN